MRTALLTVFLTALAAAQTKPDAKAIIEKSLKVEDMTDNQAVNYTYRSAETIKELDGKGQPKTMKNTVHEVLYIGGSRFNHLIEKDGKPLSGEEAKKEQERLEKAVAEASKLTEAEKAKRKEDEIAKRKKNFEERKNVPTAYDWTFLREEKLNGRDTYVLHASPRKDFKGKNANLLRNLEGDLWIDKATLHWVKVDAHALGNFSIGLFLARVGKDSQIHFETQRINDEVWLPKSVSVKADARIMVFKKLNIEQQATFSGYKRYSTDSRIVSTEP